MSIEDPDDHDVVMYGPRVRYAQITAALHEHDRLRGLCVTTFTGESEQDYCERMARALTWTPSARADATVLISACRQQARLEAEAEARRALARVQELEARLEQIRDITK